MIKRFYSICSLVLLLFGCASTPPKENKFPEWIENPDALFPARLYLTAVASGSSLDEAKERSITSLSSIFSVNVNLNRKILEVYTEKKKNKEMIDWEHSVDLINRSVLTGKNELINVRTAKTYFDKETGTFYVLSVINKAETEMIYLDEIKKTDKSLVSFYAEAGSTENKIAKIIYLKKCEEMIKIGEGLRAIHRILSLMEDTPALPVPKEDIEVELQRLKMETVAHIETSGDETEEFASYLREVVYQTGFSVGEENPDIIIKGKLGLKPLDFPREGDFIRWELTIDVKNALTGNTMKTYTSSGREGSVSPESARGRALDAVKKELEGKFFEDFNSFLSESYKE
jgi:hypothetical protein